MLTNQNFVKVFFLETHVERISNLQDIKKAELDRETGLFLYEDMTLGRRFEDKCAEMYYRGKMFGFVHLYNGQEAISTGVIGAMKKKHDWFCSTYRDHVHALSAGVPSFEVMSELFGKSTGMHGEEVDGMDVLAVRGAAQRAIERARAGEGPTLLECLTYRYRGHSLADPDELRSEKEKEFWGKRDPIKKLAQEIIDGKFATEEELKIIEKKIDTEISESVKNAIEAPEPPSEELTKYIWAED